MRFNADEIFEMAVEIERNGERFYRKAAEMTTGTGRAFLSHMADMEAQHEICFEGIRKALKDVEMEDPDGVAAKYLQSMADGKVFHEDPTLLISGSEDIEDLIRIAIGFEKDSIVFFQSLKSLVRDQTEKDKVENLIMEEVGHVADLRDQLVAIKEGLE